MAASDRHLSLLFVNKAQRTALNHTEPHPPGGQERW